MRDTELNDVHEEPDQEPAKTFLTDARKKGIKDELDELYRDMMDEAETWAAEHISAVATDRARKFLERVMAGDEKAASSLFEFGHGSRYRTIGFDEGAPWASLIHGSVFETSAVTLRRKLVETHAESLKDERVKDLEATIEGLSKQIAKLEKDRSTHF